MKTNQLMTHPMGQFHVIQRTADGMFCATDLLKQWNEASLSDKRIQSYFDNNATTEFVNALITEEKLNSKKSCYLKTRGKNGGMWIHPLLFIDFAMWINPSFKVKVLKFVYDQMIKYRNDAGDAYRELGYAIGKLVNKSFMPIAMSNISKAINFCVFNANEKMMRNKEGEESKMCELWQLEHKIADLINDGFLKTYEEAISYLRKTWRNKYTPKLLQ